MIVDTDAGERALAQSLLERAGWPSDGYSRGDQALAAARREGPLLVLVDVRLDDISGYEVCRQLKDEHGEKVAIVFMSHDRTEPSDREAGFLLGADDYLAKPLRSSELLACVRGVLELMLPTAPTLTAERRQDLTPRELEVLRLLARGLNPHDIAAQLMISPKTVEQHVDRILEKLPANSRAEAVAMVRRRDRYPDNLIQLRPNR
ncbi:MAG TPA: response regulator transcription factor [Thermoleophilaceae bacterium]